MEAQHGGVRRFPDGKVIQLLKIELSAGSDDADGSAGSDDADGRTEREQNAGARTTEVVGTSALRGRLSCAPELLRDRSDCAALGEGSWAADASEACLDRPSGNVDDLHTAQVPFTLALAHTCMSYQLSEKHARLNQW